MPRKTKTITFSLPPEMAMRVEEFKQDEGRTTSELLREALRHYFDEREQSKAFRNGRQGDRERHLLDQNESPVMGRHGSVRSSSG